MKNIGKCHNHQIIEVKIVAICSLSHYKLYPLSGDCREELLPRAHEQTVLRLGLAVLCGNKQVASFELTLNHIVENK